MRSNSDKTILVTGITGQQGGAVARRLLADGWRDRVRGRVESMLPSAARAHRRAAVLASLERQADMLAGALS